MAGVARRDWVYRVVVPPEKSDLFIEWLVQNGLADEEHLTVKQKGDQ